MSSLLERLARVDGLKTGPRATAPRQAEREEVPSRATALRSSVVGDEAAAVAFEAEQGPHGVRYVRRTMVPRSSRFGAVSLETAVGADLRLLARLALAPELERASTSSALFLDTETSGLGGGSGNRAFLVGLSWFESEADAFVVEQLFLRDLDDEPALIAHVGERVANASVLVTYNGKSFDWPLLRTRATLARVGQLAERPHLDLLHVARRIHRRRGFPMNLGTVERQVLRYDRGPDVGGAEVALRYAQYLFSGDPAPLEDVVRHNHHDVVSLIALLGHYGRAPSSQPEADPTLAVSELSAMARVVRRAGDLDWANRIADEAVDERDEDDADAMDALFTRARIAKARGDRATAIEDLEALLARGDDGDARLELAKLYEHYLRQPARALEMVELGTSESLEETELRRARLRRKAERRRR